MYMNQISIEILIESWYQQIVWSYNSWNRKRIGYRWSTIWIEWSVIIKWHGIKSLYGFINDWWLCIVFYSISFIKWWLENNYNQEWYKICSIYFQIMIWSLEWLKTSKSESIQTSTIHIWICEHVKWETCKVPNRCWEESIQVIGKFYIW